MSLLTLLLVRIVDGGRTWPTLGGGDFRKHGDGRWGPVTRTVRFGLGARRVAFTCRARPTRKEAPQPRARIDNWPPPVCTRSVRLSIGHQETMMPSPFSYSRRCVRCLARLACPAFTSASIPGNEPRLIRICIHIMITHTILYRGIIIDELLFNRRYYTRFPPGGDSASREGRSWLVGRSLVSGIDTTLTAVEGR